MLSLVSFADGPFRPRAEAFVAEARALDTFDTIAMLNSERLPPEFLKRHSGFLSGRGFGYWIWKPVVIAEALKELGKDDLLVYLDAGFTLNPNGVPRLREYFDICRDSPDKMLSFMNPHTESTWTKADLAARLGVEKRADIMKTSQLSSGFIVLANTRSNKDVIDTWAALALENDYHFSDDSPSGIPNHPLFQEHRHDQSISSLVRKMRGTAITHYEVRLPAMREQVPAWATRSKS